MAATQKRTGQQEEMEKRALGVPHSNEGVPMKKPWQEKEENNLTTIYTGYYIFQVRKKGNEGSIRANTGHNKKKI